MRYSPHRSITLRTRVLIITVRLGDGHWQASRAIQSEFRRQVPGATVDIVDYAQFLNRAFISVVQAAYPWTIRHAPRLYGEFYRRTDRIPSGSLVQRRLNTIGRSSLRAALDRYRPDLVVCTYPTPGAVVSHLRQAGHTNVPIATVITDYTYHKQWLHPLADMSFVGCEQLAESLIEAGLRPERVHNTGIPIRSIFAQAIDKAQARERLGLRQDCPTVLIMGGSCGVLPHAELVPRMLQEAGPNVQAVAICGRNERLRSALEQEAQRYGVDSLQVHGFVEHVNEFMAASDLMIGKAGGLTISEALATHLPMVIHRPIVGQEAHNARFLAEAGAAMIAHTPQELQWLLKQLMASPDRLSEMQAAAALAKPHAAADMVRIMLARLGRPIAASA